MKEWAESFYKSQRWKKVRHAYLSSQNYICERCGRLAEMVHHKVYLTEDNINNIDFTCNWDNLEALCNTCHQAEHNKGDVIRDDLCFSADGQLMRKPPCFEKKHV